MKVKSNLNHSAGHLLAAAVLKLYPGTHVGFGPAIDEGFYYDFVFKNPINDQDLKKIEKQMSKIVAGGYKIEQVDSMDILDQPFKQELVKDLGEKNIPVTYYALNNPSNGQSIFTDVCKGGHVASVSQIKHFKLLNLAGAYWKGDSKNAQLTRIYGTAWETKEELRAYLQILQERKERDHRKIGKEMNIFTFNHLAGQGFPIWLEDGMIIKNNIQSYIRKLEGSYGFREVSTPAFGSKKLYEISGHWAHYQDDMFPVIELENEELVMRPMTCPHHVLIYGSKRRSYRDLPIRMSEQAQLYRYEKSGALTGLERVRSMVLTEGHVFARTDQIIDEFKNSYKLIMEALDKFNIEVDYISLSLRDPEDKEKYLDDDDMWNKAESDLVNVLKELKIVYIEKIGEAAFYGPKIDIQVKSALGHEITLSTLQLDFLLPKRFDISYIDKDENKVTPVLIHRGLIGTYERFIAILLEQTKGDLPFWLAPRQATIIPVSHELHQEYADNIYKKLVDEGIRVHMDDRNERVSKKIREAQTSKTKWQIVIGDEEVKNNTINIRAYGSNKQKAFSVDEFIKKVAS
ncbi:threonine--tRNA ligase [Candidatus Mycoplasma mahonii]|uniref:threonine--tRNA ligase n=1 Tax=Candidatus Mycoplasma mahonii TaxID=3004105 RepID=UPI0026F1D559|nr:threonine--tRNA ligase [Candidatus Mycoplasma mahonii]WKX02304.1 threonine--tRNA ligase [Candidatus Mycoplasma mahonii]